MKRLALNLTFIELPRNINIWINKSLNVHHCVFIFQKGILKRWCLLRGSENGELNFTGRADCAYRIEAQSQCIPPVRKSLRKGRRELARLSSRRGRLSESVFQIPEDKNREDLINSASLNINHTKYAKMELKDQLAEVRRIIHK